jgi:hypothetical protein
MKQSILSPEQQNMAQRLQLCDGCNDPHNRPVYKMLVEVGTLTRGHCSKSMFLVCNLCAAKPISLYLHGKGYCAPGVKVEEHVTLGGATLERLDEIEPEIIDNRPVRPETSTYGGNKAKVSHQKKR